MGDLPSWLELNKFDAILIHYSLIACYDNYISPHARQAIKAFKGFKAVFIQDDYRWIDDTVSALAYMEINALFPLTNPDIMDAVYSPAKLPNVRKETVLTGYVPEHLLALSVPQLENRTVDVGYRARKLPAWMGSHTLQKWQIAERFAQDAPAYGLKVDLSCKEEDRIYGDDWIKFLTNCKATLGTESGASICDFTGNIQRNVEEHLKIDPNATFEQLRDLYFANEDGKIMMNVISPRCFESAALKTLLILYEGYYSGVLIPDRHYIPLRKDHSNMHDVARILNTPALAKQIIDNAYNEVACNKKYTFEHMVQLVDHVMHEEFNASMLSSAPPYSHKEFDWRKSNSYTPIEVTSLDTQSEHRISGYEIAFKDKSRVKRLAFRLDSKSANPVVVFKVYDNDDLLYSKKHNIGDVSELQVFDFGESLPKGTKLVISELQSSKEVPVLLDGLEIYGDIFSIDQFISSSKTSLFNKLEILWSNTPDSVKIIVRPCAKLVKKLVS